MTGECPQPHFLIMKPINMISSLFCKTSRVGHMAAETKGKKKSTTSSLQHRLLCTRWLTTDQPSAEERDKNWWFCCLLTGVRVLHCYCLKQNTTEVKLWYLTCLISTRHCGKTTFKTFFALSFEKEYKRQENPHETICSLYCICPLNQEHFSSTVPTSSSYHTEITQENKTAYVLGFF